MLQNIFRTAWQTYHAVLDPGRPQTPLLEEPENNPARQRLAVIYADYGVTPDGALGRPADGRTAPY